jgi:hypothetical protein
VYYALAHCTVTVLQLITAYFMISACCWVRSHLIDYRPIILYQHEFRHKQKIKPENLEMKKERDLPICSRINTQHTPNQSRNRRIMTKRNLQISYRGYLNNNLSPFILEINSILLASNIWARRQCPTLRLLTGISCLSRRIHYLLLPFYATSGFFTQAFEPSIGHIER